MQHAQRLTLGEMREFVASSGRLSFTGAERKQIYGLVERTLRMPNAPATCSNASGNCWPAAAPVGKSQHEGAGPGGPGLGMDGRGRSDTECARHMQQRKRKLLASCRSRW